MRMKEDAMGNGQLKPVFNLQHGVDSEYIVWLTVGPQPTDTQFWIVLKYGFFTKKTIVSIDTAQLYRENREKGSCLLHDLLIVKATAPFCSSRAPMFFNE